MCNARKVVRTKTIKIRGDEYRQTLERCTGCAIQTKVQLRELKRGKAHV